MRTSAALLLSLASLSCSAGAFYLGTPLTSPLPPGVSTLAPSGFLLPVGIEEASGLSAWQFDLFFDNSVVNVVDPLDGTSGIYGAEFTAGVTETQSFILGGFPLNALGLVDDVAGSYPFLTDGVSGTGLLAYVQFQFLPGQAGRDPAFRIGGAPAASVPETPSILLVVMAFAALIATRQTTLR